MTRSGILAGALLLSGCSYFQSAKTEEPTPAESRAKPASVAPANLATGAAVLRAMHDRYDGKYLKSLSFLQNNTSYTTTGEERKSQWYVHIAVPGKMRIAFLPAPSHSGLVQVGDRVASFDNGMRVDFRPAVNPMLLLTTDVFVAPNATIMRGLDSLRINAEVMHAEEWDGRPVYVIGAKEGDSASNQVWVDRERLQVLRVIQHDKAGTRAIVSDTQVRNYKSIEGFDVPTEVLVLRNGRPALREQFSDIRVNEEFPAGTFDQARWNEIPIPK
jgi:hypothetical protein